MERTPSRSESPQIVSPNFTTSSPTRPMLLSLSMKMRAESAATRPNTSNLPIIRKRRPSNIHLKSPIPKSEVSILYERLSGTFNTAGFESFPSRETVVHPSTLCVRCSSAASLCVPCADIMAQDAVGFFRKSQAVGAYHLFDGAIKQAGAGTVLRFIVFRCWKNSVHVRHIARRMRSHRVDKIYNVRLLKDPFRYWVKFTRECQSERQSKREQQLEDKIKVLEQQLNKLSAEKIVADKQIRAFISQKSDMEDEANGLRRAIEELEELNKTIKIECQNQVEIERRRVLELIKLIEESIPPIVKLVKTSLRSSLTAATRQIALTQQLNINALNLSKVLKPPPNPKNKRTVQGEVPPETIQTMLTTWMNNVSLSASDATLPGPDNGNMALEEYLPAYVEMQNLSDITNGTQLARVVLKLISQLSSAPPSAPTAQQRRSKAQEPTAPTALIVSRTEMEDIQNSISNPHTLIFATLCFAKQHLQTPLFCIDHILAGREEAVVPLVSHLFLTWCGLPGHSLSPEERVESQKVAERQSKLMTELESTTTSIISKKLLSTGLLDLIAAQNTPKEPNSAQEKSSGKSQSGTNKDSKGKSDEKGRGGAQSERKKEAKGAAPEALSSGDAPAESPPQDAYNVDTESYCKIADRLDNYVDRRGASDLLSAITALERSVDAANDLYGSVYMKQKAAAASVQYLLDIQRKFATGSNEIGLSTSIS